MRLHFSKFLLIGLSIVAASNLIVLARAAYNRSGAPEGMLVLTERELSHSYAYYHRKHENSSLSFYIKWQIGSEPNKEGHYYDTRTFKINAEKLAQLGFDASECANSWQLRRSTKTKAWLALEYQGEQYRKHLAAWEAHVQQRQREVDSNSSQQEQSELNWSIEQLKRLRDENSRLYVVDLALGKTELKQKYTDSNYLFLPALIAFHNVCDGQNDSQSPSVYISKLLIGGIHVPKSLRDSTDDSPEYQYGGAQSLRYTATIAFGKLGEPWLMNWQMAQ